MRFLSHLLAVLCTLLLAGSAHAGVIVVNSLADTEADDGQCTLREAIIAANDDSASGSTAGECAAGAGDDEILIEVAGTLMLTSQLPTVTGSVEIIAGGADVFTVDGDETHRAFVFNSPANNGTFVLRGMTVQRAKTLGGFAATSAAVDEGDELTIEFVRFFDTVLVGAAGVVSCEEGTLNMRWSTVELVSNLTGSVSPSGVDFDSCNGELAHSTVTGCACTGVRVRNALPAGASRTVDIRHSTISQNISPAPSGGLSFFASAAAAGTMTLNLRHSTVVLNSALSTTAGSAGGVTANGGENAIVIENSVIALNTAPNASSGAKPDIELASSLGSFNTLGYNFVGENTGATTLFPAGFPNGNGDYVGSLAAPLDPGLNPLADNGGPTKTHAPDISPVSPLIDKSKCPSEPYDQRGRERIFDVPGVPDGPDSSGCDIGAVEVFADRLPLALNATAYLYGAYDASLAKMREHPALPAGQPYGTSPWNYFGMESTPFSSGVTDWVLVRLREGAPDGPIAYDGAGLLTPDGELVNGDGSGPWVIESAGLSPELGPYHVEIVHRNHAPAVSRLPVFLTPGTAPSADLSLPERVAGTNGIGKTTDGKFFALWPGDADGSGAVEPSDAQAYFPQKGQSGYLSFDFDFDGDVDAADVVLMFTVGHGR